MLTAGLLLSAGIGLFTLDATAGSDDLAAVEQDVRKDFPAVSHLGTAAFADVKAADDDVLIVDVRETDEFAVSHIAGANNVPFSRGTDAFLRSYGGDVAGKTIVFYCSVGVRSSKVADRLQADLRARGAKAVYNVDGGIFRWHGEARPLVDQTGATAYVHPYDTYWGRLVKRRKFLSYSPRTPSLDLSQGTVPDRTSVR